MTGATSAKTCWSCGEETRAYKLQCGHVVCGACRNSLVKRRAGAWIADSIAIYVAYKLLIAGANLYLEFGGSLDGWSERFLVLAILLTPALLLLVKDGLWGQSPGKLLFGVVVIDRTTASPAGVVASMKRNLPLLFPVIPLLAATQISSGPRIGDGWANTLVVLAGSRDRRGSRRRRAPDATPNRGDG